MAIRPQQTRAPIETASGGLDPALLRIIEAMARADARRDYQAALERQQGLRPPRA